jgi:hypothetical protein
MNPPRRALALALLAWPTVLVAHAFLDHASPAVGSSVRQAPSEVRLWFTQPLEPAFSTVHVFDAEHRSVEQSASRADPKDPSILAVPVRALGPGKYRVEWRVLSSDTHVTQGDFTFEVTP